MSSSTIIKTTKTIYPQIYAYVIPEYKRNEGWIKIGYTEQKDVDMRIRQQTQTAGIAYTKLWSEPAKFINADEWFHDKQLHAYLRRFKKIDQRPNTEWFYYDGKPEQAHVDFDDFRHRRISQIGKELEYQLRDEQDVAVRMTLSYAENHPGGEFLWNAKPRFGKTLTTYDLVRRMKAKNVLIVTNRPAIANSWFDDFETFIAWQTAYRFISTTDTLKDRAVLTREQFEFESQKNDNDEQLGCIAFISLQDLKGSIFFGGFIHKLEWVKNLKWDLLVIDEAHEGIDTFKTDIAFNNIYRDFTLHLSGTPFKAVASGRFTQSQIFNWTYADEQAAKTNWSEENEAHNPYEGLPRLNLFSYQISKMITDEINKGAQIDGKDIDFAFDLNEFFATGSKGKFIYEVEVKKWLDTLTQNDKYPYSTPILRAELKHTLWLLNRVASAKALEKLLREHPVFENYEIVLAAGDGATNEDDPVATQKSLDKVRAAIETHEKTITLSVRQLTTGVTVPEWTAVMMLSNVKSPSLYMQAAFRAQNPWSYSIDGKKYRKQNAYVFDFAPERTLIIYDEFANNLSKKTVGGSGTMADRENNIKTLLNFFPVIAEDDDGKMVELDLRQVLAIPHTIKAQEVVKRGFNSNLLFQNISGVFSSPEARKILEQLNLLDLGRITPRHTSSAINTMGVEINDNGEVIVEPSIIIAETDARFGQKLYTDIVELVSEAIEQDSSELARIVTAGFTFGVLGTAKEIAKENAVSVANVEQIVKQNANILAREIEVVKKQADIMQAEADVEYAKEIAAAENDAIAVIEAKNRYETEKQKISEKLERELGETVEYKIRELTHILTGQILQTAKERKKITVEEGIFSRLRGFTRTIPSFLMAYGEPSTRLANFDVNIDDSVFREVTGITLAQFRTLRDTYNFFDPVVFDESVQEFLRKKEELANYFDDNQAEEIFDYIPPQKTNQIYTPKWIVEMMVDVLEEEDPDLFKDKNKTFVDLYVKSGLYLTEIIGRLFLGLADEIPDDDTRLRHIIENQIYGFAPSKIIYSIARSHIFGDLAKFDDSHLKCCDLTEIARSGEDINMRFDVVVGNPPFQESGEARDEPVYHHFYNLAEKISERYCLISPARFLFNAGQTPKAWNKKMLDNKHLKVEYFEQDSESVFANTQIKGGVAIIYHDKKKIFGGIGVFTHYDELVSIMGKTSKKFESSFSTIVQPQGLYRFSELFFTDFPHAEKLQGKGTKNKIVSRSFAKMNFAFHDKKPFQDAISILGSVNGQRVYKWISPKYVLLPESFDKYRVIIAESNNTGALGETLSSPFVGAPYIAHTDTFLTVGSFCTEAEANATLKYIKTKFVRVLLGILKITQHNSRATWAKVPLQDFTSQSDINWDLSIEAIDRQLYQKYDLDEKEISFIEEKVRPMD